MSATTSRTSRPIAVANQVLSGADTTRFDAITSKPAHCLADGAKHLNCRQTRLRQAFRRHAPHPRNGGAVVWVVQFAIARKLVGLLAMLAPALAVALSRQATIARTKLCPLSPAPAPS